MRILILGRPNVGKSSLFNSIIGKRLAITANESGTTRDTIEYKLQDTDLILVDAAGIEDALAKGTDIEKSMYKKIYQELEKDDLVLFCIDSRDGITPIDNDIAKILHRSNKEIWIVATKCDNYLRAKGFVTECLSLGFERVFLTSSAQNNVYDLEDAILKLDQDSKKTQTESETDSETMADSDLDNDEEEDEDAEDERLVENNLEKKFNTTIPKFPTICLIGRPNVGKSSLLNAIVNFERSIVSDTPHTTRDTIFVESEREGFRFNIVDTAGFRRPGKVEIGIERMAIERTKTMISEADVAVLVFDVSEGITQRDMTLVEIAGKEAKALVIVANKWDLMTVDGHKPTEFEANEIAKKIRDTFSFVSWADVVLTSAVDKRHIQNLLNRTKAAFENSYRQIRTSDLNRIAQKVNGSIPTGKIFYTIQCDIRPPWFKIWVDNTERFNRAYVKAFENEIRNTFDFHGVPINIAVIERERRADFMSVKSRNFKRIAGQKQKRS